MNNYLNALREFNRDVRLFLTAVAIHGFVFFGVYALLLNLYLLRLGYEPGFIGQTNAVGPLALAIASLPAGSFSRRYGSRRALILGLLGSGLGLGLLPVNEFLPPSLQAGWILSTYAFTWFFGSFIVVNLAPFLMGTTSPKERTHAFAVQTAVFPLFGFAGNLVGGFVPGLFAVLYGVTPADAAPFRLSLMLAGAVDAFAVLAMWKTSEVHVRPVRPATPQLGTPTMPLALIVIVALIWMLRVSSEWTMRIFFNVYLDSALSTSTALIGVLLASGQLLGLMALFAPFAIARFGKERIIVWSFFGMALAFLPVLLIAHWSAVGIGFIAMIALISISGPAYMVYSQELVLPQWRTGISSAMSLSLGIGITAIAFGGGYVIVYLGYLPIFGIGALLAGLAGLAFRAYFREPRGEFAVHDSLAE